MWRHRKNVAKHLVRYLVGRYVLRRRWLVWDLQLEALRPLTFKDRRRARILDTRHGRERI